MKPSLIFFLFLMTWNLASAQRGAAVTHYVCVQSLGVYHDREHCASLQMCTGGKVRKTKNVENMTPCKKCAAPVYRNSDFANIKRVLGVKDKKQIVDSLGTTSSVIRRPGGFTMRISGLPESRTVNMLEFYFDKTIHFNEDSLFSGNFYDLLGLNFDGCKADTIRNKTPHPVTGKVKKDVSIEYRGCAIVEPRDRYEDTSKYYYELMFLSKEGEVSTDLEKIQLILRVDRL